MAYLDQANLATDGKFRSRVAAALTTEGRSKVTDPLGALIMGSPEKGVAAFMPFVASAPGLGDKYAAGGVDSISDFDILAAVQATWNDVTTVQFPPDA